MAAQVVGTKKPIGFHDSDHFPMQSAYKFPIAMAVLNAVDRSQLAPRGMVQLLKTFQEGRGLSRTSQALLFQLMTQTPTGPQRLKGLLPAGALVAHKTGTSSTKNGMTAATNDVGIISESGRPTLLIAVFVSDSPAETTVREGVIAKIASQLWRQQTQRR